MAQEREETDSDERDACVALAWKSASCTPDINSLTLQTGIKTVAVGAEHCIALGFDGLVYSRGKNDCGQLGLCDFEDRDELSPITYFNRKKIVSIDCGSRHSCAITFQGNVYCWGDTSSGQCGVGELKTVSSPARIYFIDNFGKDTGSTITQVGCGDMHTLGLTVAGQVWAWGSGVPLGLGSGMERALTPRIVEDFIGKKVISIACGSFHSMAIVNSDSLNSKGTVSHSPNKDRPGERNTRNTKLSSRLKIPGRQNKSFNKEGSNSDPVLRKSFGQPIYGSESSSSDDEKMEKKSSPKSDLSLSPKDVRLDVSEEGAKSALFPVVGSFDVGIVNITNVVMSGMLSLTSSLTGQHSSADAAIKPKRESVSPETKKNDVVHEPISVQVWTWGRGTCGQLGHGTTEDRFYPSVIDELNGIHIVKVVAGTHHSLALTSYSQVYAWGDNSHCQLGIKKNVVNKPRKVKSLSNILVWDIAAGSHYSLFLGDNSQNTPDVYVCGKSPSGLPMSCMGSLMEFQANLSNLTATDNLPKTSKKPKTLPSSKSQPDIRTVYTTLSDGVAIGQMHFRKSGVLRRIFSCNEQCVCLVVRGPPQWITVVAEIVSQERAFYYKLALIWQAILEPLLVTDLSSSNDLAVQSRSRLSKSFYFLMRHVATACQKLSELVTNVNPLSDVIAVLSDGHFWSAFENYSKVYSDSVACNAFESWGKNASSVLLRALDGLFEDKSAESRSFKDLLILPLERISMYKERITTLGSLVPEKRVEHKTLFDLATNLEKLLTSVHELMNEAVLTRDFWLECPPKLAEQYKTSYRRVMKNSKVTDLFPAKQGRFSSHWFVLLNDTFFHIQSNKNYQAYDLATVWASELSDAQGENFTNAIKITTPEDSLTLCSKTALEKAQWLVAINQAVAKIISKTTSYRLSSETVNTKCGSFAPAKAREATYFYTQEPKYKGACYNGMWLSGKPHGHGKMVWSLTAQTYEGEFRNGLYHGFGYMVFVSNASAGVAEEYEGEWKEGFMHGHGKMSYGNKQTYEGHWAHNQRHGHGVLRMGNLTSPTPSIFIGNWENDRRSGFGVMDDFMRGEKYMGMWENDVRNGKGLIVTLDGIYNEGRFVFNKLVGHGILLCNDNTRFEGEFCADAQINGKGILTLPNGDSIDGTFQGAWNTGLKVNGVYHKGNASEEIKPIDFRERRDPSLSLYYIAATKKWESVFRECRGRIGCYGDNEPELKKAWKCVAVELTRGPVMKSLKQEHAVIDDVLRGVDLDQSKKIGKSKKKLQEYLSKAFDIPCHPFGRLMDTLVDVYRATYVGMGAHSRLLPHAIEELKSYISRVYAILRILFPNLPNEDFVLVGDEDKPVLSEDEITDSNSLLGPLMFPRFHPTLFTLYALHNEKNDNAYWERVHQLNKRTDLALMSYLEIKRTFWLVPEGNDLMHETDFSNWKHTYYYERAVGTFQEISTKYSPMEKLLVLRETFQCIHKEVQDFSKGKAKLMSLDDLFPVFQFVVIRSRVHHLGSEIDFIEDLMQSEHRTGEYGHMFTTLKACYYQILNEN